MDLINKALTKHALNDQIKNAQAILSDQNYKNEVVSYQLEEKQKLNSHKIQEKQFEYDLIRSTEDRSLSCDKQRYELALMGQEDTLSQAVSLYAQIGAAFLKSELLERNAI